MNADFLKKNLAAALCLLIVTTPITQAVAAPLQEGPVARPEAPAAVPQVQAPIAGHMAPQDAPVSIPAAPAALPAAEAGQPAAAAASEAAQGTEATGFGTGPETEPSAASAAEGGETSAASAATGVDAAWEKALEVIGKARSKKLLRRAGGGTALAREAKEMQANTAKKPEVFIPEFYRGRVPLKYLSSLDTQLPAEEAQRVAALKELIVLAFKPRLDKPDAVTGVRDMRDRLAFTISPAGKALIKELGLEGEDFTSRIVDANKIDAENDIPADVWERAAKLGLMRLKVPKEFGGMGFHQKAYAEVMKSLPYVSGSLMAALSAQNTIATAPLAEFGTDAQKAKYLPKVAEGKFVSSFGLTEPGAGTDLNKMGMTAVLSADKKSWRLTGQKIFITGVDDAGMLYLVTGHTIIDGVDVGPTVLMVELPFVVGESWDAKVAKMKALDKKGLRVMSFTRDSGLKLMMIHGSDQAFIQMKDFEVPVVRDGVPTMLGAPGEGKIVPLVSLNRGRAGFGPMIWASAQSFASRALQWSADRKMFDMYAPKGQEGVQGDMEHIQAANGRTGMKAAALEAVSDLTQAIVDDNPDKGVAAISAAIKARASEDNWDIAQDALRRGGGHALFMGAPLGLERDFRDAWIALIVEGVNAAMSQFVHLIGGGGVQKEMMSPLKHPLAVPAFLARQAAARLGLVFDHGALSYEDAAWIQSRAARFAFRFGMSATATTMLLPIVNIPGVRLLGRVLIKLATVMREDMGLAIRLASVAAVGAGAASLLAPALFPVAVSAAGAALLFRLLGWALSGALDVSGRLLADLRPFEKRQDTLIDAYNVLMDLFTLSAVEIKLAKDEKAGKLSAEEKTKLAGARDFLKTRIDAGMTRISILEDPTHKIERQVGAAMLDAERQRQPQRENVVERHMKWLKEKTDAFFGGEFEGNVEEPSGIDGAGELKSAQERAKAMKGFRPPQPKEWLRKLTAPLAQLALATRFRIEKIDFPEADRERLAKAANPDTAAFFGPVHPEFGTDWIVDKVITDQYAPKTMHWAARDVVKMAPRFLGAHNVVANDGGEAAKELSIQNALAGNGVLLHPEGTVLWTADHTNQIFPGIADMAVEAAQRAGPDGKPVYIVPLVWKAEYTSDVSGALQREMDDIESALHLPSHKGLAVADRFAALQESVLAVQQRKFGVVDPLPYGINSHLSFFERQEAVRRALIERLKATHKIAESSSMDKNAQRLIKVIRAERKRALVDGDKERAESLKGDLAAAEEAKRLGKFTREIYGAKPEITQEEIGESLKRLRADLVKRGVGDAIENMAPKPYGPRVLHVRVPEPIRVDPASNETADQYLARLRAEMQGSLDGINAEIAPRVSRWAHHNPFYEEQPAADLEPILAVLRESYVLRQHVTSAISVGSLPTEPTGADDRPAQRRGDEAMRLVRALMADPAAVEANLPGLNEALGAGFADKLLSAAARARSARQAEELPAVRDAYPLRGDGVSRMAQRLKAAYSGRD